MKKITVLLIYIFISLKIVYCQLNIGVIVGSGIINSVSYLKYERTSEYQKLNLNTKQGFSYYLGGTVNYYLAKKNKLSANVLFFDKTFNQLDIITKTNFIIKNYFLTIPIYWQHSLFTKTGTNIGIMNNIFLKNSYGAKKIMNYYNLSIFVGIFYSINNKMNISANFLSDITPYSCVKVIDNSQLAYNYGAMLSVSYKLFEK